MLNIKVDCRKLPCLRPSDLLDKVGSNMRRRTTIICLLGFILPSFAQAQGPTASYPNRAIRVLVPYTAGMVDTFVRAIGQPLSERLGQPVVVDNRPGAGGQIALEMAKVSAPDGHTLVLSSLSTLVLVPAARKVPPYDALRDFTSIGVLYEHPFYLVVNPSVPAKSVQELIALAQSRPGKLFYASIGPGGGHHLVSEMFKTMARVDMVHVPYKGNAQAQTGLVAGDVHVMFEGPSVLPHVRSGKARALASTGRERAQAMPDLPTVSQSGVPGFEISTWFSLSGPAEMPRPIVDRLNREVVNLLRSPQIRQKFAVYDIELMPSTPEGMTDRIRSDIPVWTKLMRSTGIEPQ